MRTSFSFFVFAFLSLTLCPAFDENNSFLVEFRFIEGVLDVTAIRVLPIPAYLNTLPYEHMLNVTVFYENGVPAFNIQVSDPRFAFFDVFNETNIVSGGDYFESNASFLVSFPYSSFYDRIEVRDENNSLLGSFDFKHAIDLVEQIYVETESENYVNASSEENLSENHLISPAENSSLLAVVYSNESDAISPTIRSPYVDILPLAIVGLMLFLLFFILLNKKLF